MKRQKQEEENEDDHARIRIGYPSMSGSRDPPNSPARPRGVLSTPTRSRGIRLRSAAVAASAAVASVVAGCLYLQLMEI